MSNIITREQILSEKLANAQKGELVLSIFGVAEELGIAQAIDLENIFSLAAMEFVAKAIEKKRMLGIEHYYVGIRNVYYVVELYLRGYYNKEHYIGYEQFLNLVMSGKVDKLIHDSHEIFVLHINRLKKVISKSKKKIPFEFSSYANTRKILEELDQDLSICERYPATSANLTEFYFARERALCGSVLINELIGFINLEDEVYSLYNEISILSKFDVKAISRLCRQYESKVGYRDFNLFELVMNNYLFAMVYSDEPENFKISKVDAELLMREIKLGTLDISEFVNQLIDKYHFTEYRAEYLKRYGRYLQGRIESLQDTAYFGELFFVTSNEKTNN